jgi:hypothetical protein
MFVSINAYPTLWWITRTLKPQPLVSINAYPTLWWITRTLKPQPLVSIWATVHSLINWILYKSMKNYLLSPSLSFELSLSRSSPFPKCVASIFSCFPHPGDKWMPFYLITTVSCTHNETSQLLRYFPFLNLKPSVHFILTWVYLKSLKAKLRVFLIFVLNRNELLASCFGFIYPRRKRHLSPMKTGVTGSSAFGTHKRTICVQKLKASCVEQKLIQISQMLKCGFNVFVSFSGSREFKSRLWNRQTRLMIFYLSSCMQVPVQYCALHLEHFLPPSFQFVVGHAFAAPVAVLVLLPVGGATPLC